MAKMKGVADQPEVSKEIEVNFRYTDSELRKLESFDDLKDLFLEHNKAVVSVTDILGNGFVVLKQKTKLESEPLVIIDWRFSKGKQGEFVSLLCMTKGNQKVIVNDGSTGIRDQIRELEAQNVTAPVWVPNGLRVSRYEFTDSETGEISDAETWYLSV